MFQYATGWALAMRLQTDLLLDLSEFAHYGLRRYELSNFAIRGRVADAGELESFAHHSAGSSKALVRRVMQVLGYKLPLRVFKEPSFTYDSKFLQLDGPTYLDGYWQSERYFVDRAESLCAEFMLSSPLDDLNERVATSIELAGVRSVSLHVRRGDYVSNQRTAQYHGVCSLDYYGMAIKYISDHVADPIFFVFSDDLEWVRTNLHMDHQMVFVDTNDANHGAWDMELMKRCSHHVIANSSFSWWGAWLNRHPDKIVVAPRRWFSGAAHDTRDLIPASWVRL